MNRLRIRHETAYTYQAPVTFGAWRLMMRPTDTHGERLLEASFELSPPGATRWSYDAYGNSVCHFTPQSASTELRVVNNLLIDRFPAPLSPFSTDAPQSLTPIFYDEATRIALTPFINPATNDQSPAYLDWLRAQASSPGEPGLDFVMRLNNAIHTGFGYTARDAHGTQAPSATIGFSAGACRDLAWLMIESLRRFGFAARFVTGYLYAGGQAMKGAGATHAWCEVFLPDFGWIECDPTNGLIESVDLIRVACTRTPEEASPMEGIVLDNPGAFSGMHVTVSVEQVNRQM